MRFARAAVMAAAMLCASVSYGAVLSITEPATVIVLRVAGSIRAEPTFATKAQCEQAIPEIMRADGVSKTAGRWKYNCEEITSWFATFAANAPTPIDCVVTDWAAWAGGPWSACAGGQQSRTEMRTRTVVTAPANGGTACPILVENRTATQSCAMPVNCVVGAWSDWTAPAWPTTCPPGVTQTRTETRSRAVTTQASNGGTACPSLTESRTATRTCPNAPTAGPGTATLNWRHDSMGTKSFVVNYGADPNARVWTQSVPTTQCRGGNPEGGWRCSYVVRDLPAGPWYFSVTAINDFRPSEPSEIRQKVVQ